MPKRVAALPHPMGWRFLRQETELREIDGLAERLGSDKPMNATLTFNHYMRNDPDGRMHIMAIQVFSEGDPSK